MISFTLDAWTSPNCIAFLGITAHWISENWQLNEILIDFHKLCNAHSGENLAEAFVQCCNEFHWLKSTISGTYRVPDISNISVWYVCDIHNIYIYRVPEMCSTNVENR